MAEVDFSSLSSPIVEVCFDHMSCSFSIWARWLCGLLSSSLPPHLYSTRTDEVLLGLDILLPSHILVVHPFLSFCLSSVHLDKCSLQKFEWIVSYHPDLQSFSFHACVLILAVSDGACFLVGGGKDILFMSNEKSRMYPEWPACMKECYEPEENSGGKNTFWGISKCWANSKQGEWSITIILFYFCWPGNKCFDFINMPECIDDHLPWHRALPRIYFLKTDGKAALTAFMEAIP